MPVQRIYALASLIGPICPYSVVLFLFSIIHPTWSARLQSAASSAKMARLTVKVPFKFPPHQEDSPPSSHPSPWCVVFPNWSDQSSFAFLWNPFHRIHCWGGASWWRGAWGTWFGPVRGCLCCLLCPLPSVSWLVSCLYLLSAIKWRQNDRKKKKKMRTFLRNVLAPLYWQSIKCYSNTARRGQTFHCRCQGAADEDELVKWERVFPWDFSPAGLIIRTAGRIYVGASVLAWGEVEHTLNRGASCQRTHPSTAVCFKLHSCWHVSVGTA